MLPVRTSRWPARGSYKPVGSIQCTRGFLSVFFKGASTVIELNDEQFERVRERFLKSLAEVEAQEASGEVRDCSSFTHRNRFPNKYGETRL